MACFGHIFTTIGVRLTAYLIRATFFELPLPEATLLRACLRVVQDAMIVVEAPRRVPAAAADRGEGTASEGGDDGSLAAEVIADYCSDPGPWKGGGTGACPKELLRVSIFLWLYFRDAAEACSYQQANHSNRLLQTFQDGGTSPSGAAITFAWCPSAEYGYG